MPACIQDTSNLSGPLFHRGLSTQAQLSELNQSSHTSYNDVGPEEKSMREKTQQEQSELFDNDGKIISKQWEIPGFSPQGGL